MRTSIRIACAGAILTLAAQGCVADSPMDLGLREYQAKNYRAAVSHFNAELARNPDSAEAHNWRAHCFAELGERDKAIADYQQASNKAPDRPDGYYGMGFLYTEMGENDKALKLFARALEADPGHFPTRFERSKVFSSLGRHDEALEDLNRAVQARPDFEPLYNMRGLTLLELNRLEESAKDFERAVAWAPRDIVIRSQRAELHYRRGDYAASLVDLEVAYANHNGAAYPLNNLAWFLATVPQARLRNGKRAALLVDRAIDLERQRPDPDARRAFLSTKAAVLAEMGDFRSAIASQEQVVELARQLKTADLDKYLAHLASYQAGRSLVLGPDQQATTLIK